VPVLDSADERRLRIADAALALLAREGARGLTHRAVDAELGLPNGSTSYYFRTRAALLRAAAQHLIALDTADAQHISLDSAGLASLLGRWLSSDGRMRSLARMELLLAAARDPELEFMLDARKRFVARTERALQSSQADAIAIIALMDGLTLHGLITGNLGVQTAQRILERQTPLGSAKLTTKAVSPRAGRGSRRGKATAESAKGK
jgi:DNA-binding transcriptional regulator YbjK